MSDAAIACAISPPIVPAPTTAALKTNIGLGASESCEGSKSRREASGRRLGGGSAARLIAASSSTSSRNRSSVRRSDLATCPRTKKRSASQANGPPCASEYESSRLTVVRSPRAISNLVSSSPLDSGSENEIRCRLRGSCASTSSLTRPRPAGVELQVSVPPTSGYPALESTLPKPSTHAGQPRGSK